MNLWWILLVFVVSEATLLDYSPQFYNDLLDYAKARPFAFDDDTIDQLGSLFLQHQVNDKFGLCLLHNHFHIHPDEMMVEIVFNDTSRTDPRPLSELNMTHIQPSMMALTETGDRIPLEYLDVNLSSFGAFQETIKGVLSSNQNFDNFFKALAEKLIQLNRLNIFGVCIRHRDSITSMDPTHSSLETNHPRERWLKLHPMIYHSDKKEIIQNKWRKGEASATYWSFPLLCAACRADDAMCAECGCSGGLCAECGCSF